MGCEGPALASGVEDLVGNAGCKGERGPCGALFLASYLEKGERTRVTYLREFSGFSASVAFTLHARAASSALYERIDAPATIRTHSPPPNMAAQLAASIPITAAAGNAILFPMSKSKSTSTAAAILRDVFTPDRDGALGPVLKHQFLHEVIPPLRGTLARRERRHRHGRVSGAEAPSLRRALAVTVTIAGDAARFAHAHAVAAGAGAAL